MARTRRRAVAACSIVAACVLALLAQTAAAHPNKPYAVSVSRTEMPAGATATVTATVTNLDPHQAIKAVEFTPPDGFTATGPVRFLDVYVAPGGGTKAFSLTVTAPCAAGVSTGWVVRAKQSNQFHGQPGNDFGPMSGSPSTSVTGSCSLAWAEQPDPAVVNTPVGSNGPFRAGPAWPSVAVRDGAGGAIAGRPVTVTLAAASAGAGVLAGGPATAVTGPDGLAPFTGLRLTGAGTYRLSAATPDVSSPAVSDPFLVQTAATACGTGSCTLTVSDAGDSVTAVLDPGAPGVLSASLNPSTLATTPNCIGYASVAARWAVVTGPAGSRTKSATMTITKAELDAVPGGISHLQVCYGAARPEGFDPADPSTWGFGVAPGTVPKPWDADGDGVKESLLWVPEGCSCHHPRRPCVDGRRKTSSGQGQITVLMPAGDPAMRP